MWNRSCSRPSTGRSRATKSTCAPTPSPRRSTSPTKLATSRSRGGASRRGRRGGFCSPVNVSITSRPKATTRPAARRAFSPSRTWWCEPFPGASTASRSRRPRTTCSKSPSSRARR
eukprot:Amastigsp_a339527_9.p4 type:complete len:116 gc:universal Amastigsp_a339527_9:705-358(-)